LVEFGSRVFNLSFSRPGLLFNRLVLFGVLSGKIFDGNVLGGDICGRGVLNWNFGRSVLSGSDVFDRGRLFLVVIFRIVQ
jgi:hypothetical protein